MLDEKDIIRKITKSEYQIDEKTNMIPQIILTNNILWDQIIINDDEFQSKILNRELCLEHLLYLNTNKPSPLYEKVTDGCILPFQQGNRAAMLTTDKGWHVITYADRDFDENTVYSYGQFGNGINQFDAPSGICCGPAFITPTYTEYPVYIADQDNRRIVRIIYRITNGSGIGGFLPESFTVLNDQLKGPMNVTYFGIEDPNIENHKLWVSEASGITPSIACLDLNGNLLQRIRGYRTSLVLTFWLLTYHTL